MKRILLGLTVLLQLAILTVGAQASLIGANVNGTLGFNYPPGGGQFWPVQNQTISDPGVEYYYTDGANDDSVDFTATGLKITDNVKSNANGWIMTFTSDAFLGSILTEISDDFDMGGVNFSLIGDTLTFTWVGTGGPAGLRTAEYGIAPVPEPATMMLFGIGLLGLAGVSRRKK